MKGKPKKILVVDDSAMVRKIIRMELEDGGYEVIEAVDGLEALNQLANGFLPDLITLDVRMPKLDGFEICRKLVEEKDEYHFKDQHPPIIFITSKDTVEDRRKGFELGAADFITKPFEKGVLLSAVNIILRPGKIVKSHIAMVVDDSAIAREIIADTLKREGMDVFEAENGIQALEIIKKQKSNIDIVITDLFMPEMDGVELTRRIRNEADFKDVPIIFLTSMNDQSELLNIFKAGATDYIMKPFAKEELIARTAVHVERERLNRRLRKTVSELQKAIKQIKILSGMLPICASCKKIRDDKGYWNQIELYIRDHSDAKFTHGICPECAKKLYPDYF